jgi:hypothetical protein
MEELRRNPLCSQFSVFTGFIDMVKTQMIIVEEKETVMLTIERSSARKIMQTMSELVRKFRSTMKTQELQRRRLNTE